MPLLGTRGAASARGFGFTGGAAGPNPFVAGTITYNNNPSFDPTFIASAIDTDGTLYFAGMQQVFGSYKPCVWKYSSGGVVQSIKYDINLTGSFRSLAVSGDYLYLMFSNQHILVLNKSNLTISGTPVKTNANYSENFQGYGASVVSGSNLIIPLLDGTYGFIPTSLTGTITYKYIYSPTVYSLYSRSLICQQNAGKIYIPAYTQPPLYYNVFYALDIATGTIGPMFTGTYYLAFNNYDGSGTYSTRISCIGNSTRFYIAAAETYSQGISIYCLDTSIPAGYSTGKVWYYQYQLGITNTGSYGPASALDSSGNLYVSYSQSTSIYLLKINSSGNVVWARSFQFSYPSITIGGPTQLYVSSSYVIVSVASSIIGVMIVRVEPLTGIPAQTKTYAGYNVVVSSVAVTRVDATGSLGAFSDFTAGSGTNSFSSATTTFSLVDNSYIGTSSVTSLTAV